MNKLFFVASVNLGYKCNNFCIFCNDWDKRYKAGKTSNQIFDEILNAKKNKIDCLELLGGEITIRSDLMKIVSFAKKLKFKTISCLTNGRMFSYEGFTKKIIDAGISKITFSIHGHNAKIHDSLTRAKGSFQQLLEGIYNLKKNGFMNFSFNTVIVKDNYRHLVEIGKFFQQQEIFNGEYIFIDPNFEGIKNFYKIVPQISKVSFHLKKCFDEIKNNNLFDWRIRYLPLCQIIDYPNNFSEFCELDDMQNIKMPIKYNLANHVNLSSRIKTARCSNCRYINLCGGIWEKYFKYFGDYELNPIKKRIKNIEKMLFKYYLCYP